MNVLSIFLPIAVVWGLLGFGPQTQPKPAEPAGLDSVLKAMDTAAANFRALQADFE
jgi:hypothetical protein